VCEEAVKAKRQTRPQAYLSTTPRRMGEGKYGSMHCYL